MEAGAWPAGLACRGEPGAAWATLRELRSASAELAELIQRSMSRERDLLVQTSLSSFRAAILRKLCDGREEELDVLIFELHHLLIGL